MKVPTLLLASVVAAAAFAAAAGGAFAATTVGSSKSNSMDRIAAEACKKEGGTIYTDQAGAKVCVVPGVSSTTIKTSKSNGDARTSGTTSSTVNSSRSNSDYRTAGITEADCTARGGNVLTAENGSKICVAAAEAKKLKAVADAAAPTPAAVEPPPIDRNPPPGN